MEAEGEWRVEGLRNTVCETRVYTEEVKTHEHAYGQLTFPLEGSMCLDTPSESVLLQKGSCLYLPPACSHSFSSPGRNRFLVLDIPSRFLSDVTGKGGAAVTLKMDDRWKSLSQLFLREAEEAPNGEASHPVEHLVRYACGILPKSASPSLEYLQLHFAEPLTTTQLAAIEHYHPKYYIAWFKKMTGHTPTSYILQLRMNAAKQLLRETALPVSMIGQEVGYAYAGSFIKLFSRSEGMTPQQYRRGFR
ncbi:helix-turn-helix transcriptional regulator [Paenibacillus stellifer]|uniref:helix-turn-helix transcriptional regulator n=1 Tax=Paenibacillus stellifer TaxID=169760 RepID=UPI000A03F5AD|nr:AraC family transcriptional regulator [Paenibacillus stellifer]